MTESLRRYDFAAGSLKRLDSPKRSPHGFVTYEGVSTRAGVFEYIQADGGRRLELRPPEWVNHPESLANMANKPLTSRHPDVGFISDANVASYQRGLATTSRYDEASDEVVTQVTATVGESIAEIDSGEAAELSWGYDIKRLDKAPKGATWNGQPYTHIQVGPYDYNHLAHVPRGRAGEGARLRLDSADVGYPVHPTTDPLTDGTRAIEQPPNKEPDMGKKKTLRLDAFAIEEEGKFVVRQGTTPFEVVASFDTMDAAQAEVDKLHAENMPDEAARGQAAKDAYTSWKEMESKQDAQKTELETMRADRASLARERDQLKARLDAKGDDTPLTPEEMDRRVKAGVTEEITARFDAAQKALPMLRPEDRKDIKALLGMNARQIKARAIAVVRPHLRLDSQSDVYVNALFDELAGRYAASDEHLELLAGHVQAAESHRREDEGEPAEAEQAGKNKYEKLG